jgi:4-carboxymuconolactone decarboxylase
MPPDDRTQRGAEILRQLHADFGAPNVLAPLEEIAPDLKNMVRDFAFGEVYARPGLALKQRQLVTVAALAAMGNTGIEFKAHLHGALKLGWTKDELVEALMQIAIYAGFPAAIHALLVAKEVFAEHGARGSDQ